MNHSYKRLFNRSLNVWQAVPETARARGKASRSARATAGKPGGRTSGKAGAMGLSVLSALISGAGLSLTVAGGPVLAQPAIIDDEHDEHVIVDGSDPDGSAPGTRPSPWEIDGTLYIGNAGKGVLTIEGGGRVSNTGGYIGTGDSEGTVTVSGTDADGNASTWTNFSSLYIGDAMLTIEDGGRVTNADAFIGDQDSSEGTVRVSGQGSHLENSFGLYVGSYGIGALTIEDGGQVSNTRGTIGWYSNSEGTVIVSGTDADGNASTWTNSRDLVVGEIGAGTLTVSDGGVVSSAATRLGLGGTGTLFLNSTGVLETGSVGKGPGTGTLTFDGGILRATAHEADFLRNFDTGNVRFGTDGAIFDTNGFDIGIGTDLRGGGGLTKVGAGVLTLIGDSNYGGYTIVDEGTLTIENGGSVTNSFGYVGQASDSDGAVIVSGRDADGNASTWTNDGVLNVGYGGTGSLTIEDGGQVANKLGYIGWGSNSEGTVTVSGTDAGGNASSWTNDGALHVGHDGTGMLMIEDGGQVSSIWGDIGYQSNSDGTVIVSGTDADGNASTWTNSYDLVVGHADTGRLTIKDGGKVSNTGGFVGYHSEGVVIVSGSDADGNASTWTNNGDLSVSVNGTGSLTIAEGGNVHAGSVTLASSSGTGTLNIGAAAGDDAVAAGTLEAGSVDFGNGTATLNFNHTDDDYGVAAALTSTGSGTHSLNHHAGTTTLTGNSSSFGGTTTVSGGTLLVGDQDGSGALGGSLDVHDGATLGGSGTVGSSGSTTRIADGGILAPGNSIGTLDFGGNLVLSSGSILDFQLGGPGSEDDPTSGVSDRIHVAEDLILDGTLNLSQSGDASDGTAGFGYYRLMTYGGTLDGDGLTIEDTPSIDNAGYRILTDTEGQFIDLFVGALGDDQLQRWQGGDGAWTASGETWRNIGGDGTVGDIDVAWAGNTAVFDHASGGTVDVEGTQGFAGLQFRNGDFVLEGSGQLQTNPDGSEIRVLADQAEIATAIKGPGGVGITGGGTLILSGNNRYEGGTTLAGGTTLSVSDDTNLGHADGALTFNGGTLATTDSFDSARDVALSGNGRFDVADDTTLGLSGDIAGSGDLRLVGNGTLELTGANDYGNTVVEAGTLLGNVEAISGDIANAGTVVFDQGDDATFTGDIVGFAGDDGGMIKQGDGVLTLDGTSTLDWSVEAGGLVSASDRFGGDLEIGEDASFTFDQESDGHYAGTISGVGELRFSGGGSVELTGDSGGYTGTTAIDGTTLTVNDAFGGALAVGDGGRLQGEGTVGTTTLADRATIAPGNSIGELTVDGDLTFEAGSSYEVEVDPTGGDSDHIHVTGTAFLDGSVVHIGLGESDDYAPESRYRILSAEGGLVGEFGEVTSAFTFLDAALAYDTESDLHGVELTLERNDIDFAEVAGTRNQRATAGGVDTLAAGHGVYDAIVTHTGSEAELRDAYDRLSGELHASAHGALIEDSRLVRQAANDRLRAASGAATVPMDIGDNPTATNPTATPSTAWVRAIGNWGSNDGDGNAASLGRDTFGVIAGVDTQVNERVRAGVLTGYTRGDISIGGGRDSADVDSAHFGLYAGARLDDGSGEGELSLRGGAFYGYHEVDSQRHVQVGTLSERLEDERSAHTLHAYGELAYRVDAGPVTLEPFANLAHVHHRTSSSEESGGDAALRSDSQTSDTSFATLGVRPSVEVNIGDADATLYGSVGWRHAFGDTTPDLDQRFAGGDAFSVAGTPIAENSAVVEAGVSVALNELTALDLAYGGQYGDGMEDHGARATFEWRF